MTAYWLDLANAYGSVHHGLIDYALKHYHAPPCFRQVVSHLYDGFGATITSSSWTTQPIPLQVGVYQSDPLSVVVFNTVMATLVDALKVDSFLGYTFSQSSRLVNVLQYADDTCLVANGLASCQRMLGKVAAWLEWTGMKVKLPKCHSLAIKASSGRRYDPKLQLCGKIVPFVGDNTIKFLGGPITIPLSCSNQMCLLVERLDLFLQRVDVVTVTRKQNLLLYKVGIFPRLSWDQSIASLPLSWVRNTLESRATKYLKKWSGLARSSDPARLYLSKSEGGLQLPQLSLLYEKLKCSQACSLLTSQDGITHLITSRQIHREDRMKRILFRPMIIIRDLMAQDPGVSRGILR